MKTVSRKRAWNFKDIRGQRFGKLTVQPDEPVRDGNHVRFIVRCDCGSEPRSVSSCGLVTGKNKSCGCLKSERIAGLGRAKLIDLTGDRFEALTVLGREPNLSSVIRWRVRCDCGTEKVVSATNLRAGLKSCGCAHNPRNTTHHQAAERTPTYISWRAMRERCLNPNASNYEIYGGRGISICKQWDSFEVFLNDMGPRPQGTTIDRYPDNDGNYEPLNCRWASVTEQGNNRSTNKMLVHNGRSQTIADWAREVGVSRKAIAGRLKQGWSVSDALTKPVAYSKISIEQAKAIFERHQLGEKSTALAAEFSVSVWLVYDILRGRRRIA